MIGPRLKDLGRWVSGGTPPRNDESHWRGNVPWISGKDFDSDRLRPPTEFVTADAAQRYSRLVAQDSPAIVVLVRGMALAHGLPVALVDELACINQDVRALIPHPAYEPRYIRYAILGARPRLDAHIDRAAHGTARLTDTAYSERIWCPAREQQSQIADQLDAECERIERLAGGGRALARQGTVLQRFASILLEYRDALIYEAVSDTLALAGAPR